MPKFTVKKSSVIQAPREKIYNYVRDFREWPTWSPWLIAEPGCNLDYAADGRSYSWDGEIIGAGQMDVEDESAPDEIRYRLTFLKPWKSVSAVSFSFDEDGDEPDDETRVSWTMEGSLPFFLFWMKPMMTAFVGMDYERGLKMLKDVLETGSVPSKLDFPGRQAFGGCEYVAVQTKCSIPDVGPNMERDFQKLFHWFEESGVCPAGKPFSIYRRWNMAQGSTEYTAGIPVASAPANLPSGLVTGNAPPCDAYQIKHTGPYRHLGNAWAAGMFRVRARVFQQTRKIPPFEVYESDPATTPEDELVTSVHFPLK